MQISPPHALLCHIDIDFKTLWPAYYGMSFMHKCNLIYASMAFLQVSPSRVIVAGDSAGGNLAISLGISCREHKVPQPAGLVIEPHISTISIYGASDRF